MCIVSSGRINNQAKGKYYTDVMSKYYFKQKKAQ